MVGTIEPRKGHLQTLAAFELLWQQGQPVNLVIVGKEGWFGLPDKERRTIPQITAKLRNHQELGQRLFWLEGISDDYLEQIYATSTCLIAASEGEGFGLPLIEAAQHQLPILARDIPVFREVAGDHAYYFKGNAPVDLQQAINDWLQHYSAKKHPTSTEMSYLTWAENAKQLGQLLSSFNQNSNIHSEYKAKPKLYIDISVVYRNDFKTGIQRVVRAILSELIDRPPVGYSVCPVYLDNAHESWVYYAVPDYITAPDNTPINPSSADILLGLDLAGWYVINAFDQGLYQQFMAAGVRIYFVVYDLLPVLAPQFFNEDVDKAHQQWLTCIAQSDGVICISKAVADEFASWSTSLETPLADDFSINYFHLGADIAASQPSSGLPDDADIMLDKLSQRPSFLMVGTLEPRKGHAQTLAAFEQLWQQGIDVNLIMVGKQGWKMSAKIKQMRQHPEIGQRLFWLENISDEYLTKLYAASTCLIAASEGEGFGLPLIEAAQNKVPIIARNIPVFREVAGDHAYYFQGLDAESLAEAINEWLGLYQQGMAPDSSDMPWLTWAQSAQQLLDSLLQNPQRNCP
jgi:glycosyltransferase involved in cell wall biosynthesis